MTTPINLKQIACLLCIAVLMSGCALVDKIHFQYGTRGLTTHHDLEVDGRLYHYCLCNHYEKGQFVYAMLHARLLSEENARQFLSDRTAFRKAMRDGEFQQRMENGGIRIVTRQEKKQVLRALPCIELKQNYFHITDFESNEVLFEMPLEELGDNIRRDTQFVRRGLNIHLQHSHFLCEEELKEAMTRVIRENVKP